MQKNPIKAVRGTRDLLPPETALWNFVEAAARDVFRVYDFHEIRTPIFEETQLFARSVGEETDIVAKEMYSWPEGGIRESAVVAAWLTRHRSEIKDYFAATSAAREWNTELIVTFSDDRSKAVEFVGSARQASSRLRFNLLAGLQFKPSPHPRLIVIAGTGDPPERILEMSRKQEVEIEAIEIPGYEEPSSLTLRPENTAGVVRAYIEHRLWERPGLQKLYYIGPQFRRERPQKGRYRQFYQIGAEVIGPAAAGSESPAVDAEVLEMLATLLDRVGIQGWTLELNSVGCSTDRPKYHAALQKALATHVKEMCADCQRRAETNPMRIFDCKVEADQPTIAKLPRMSEFLDDACRAHFAEVQALLQAMEVPFTVNDRLVRGLDYYSRTAFEFTHGALGAQNAILGGGRYDGLSEMLGGPAAPGIGFAIGEDRLVMAAEESAEAIAHAPDVYIAPLGPGMDREAAKLARELRQHDLIVRLGDESFRLKKSLETAAKLGARFALILGENEVKSGDFALKNLATGEQVSVPRAELAQRISSSR